MFRVLKSPGETESFEKIALFVNGIPVKADFCRVSAIPFNTPWPGHQRPVEQSEETSFLRIVTDEKIEIEAYLNRSFQKPSSDRFPKISACGRREIKRVFLSRKRENTFWNSTTNIRRFTFSWTRRGTFPITDSRRAVSERESMKSEKSF